MLGELQGLDGTRGGNVGAPTEVYERPAAVGGGVTVVRDLSRDELHFEGVVREEAKGLRLCKNYALKGLFGFAYYLSLAGYDWKVTVKNGPAQGAWGGGGVRGDEHEHSHPHGRRKEG